ncbi:MAG: ribonuclease P protein component [Candidatus Firestonebacteria bacterium]
MNEQVSVQDFTFSKSEHLTKNDEFDKIYKVGKRYSNKFFLLNVLEKSKVDTKYSRIGFSVGKKIAKAVLRNKLKRKMREIFRTNKYKLIKKTDLLLTARQLALSADYKTLETAILDLFKKSTLIN